MNEPQVGRVQVCNSFPNNNKKRIDFVLTYEETLADQNASPRTKEDSIRAEFFTQLANEKVETYDIEYENKDGVRKVMKLLHCPLDRLLIEAEKVNLEMPLKKDTLSCIKNEKKQMEKAGLWQTVKTYGHSVFDDNVESSLSARFENSLKFLFECDNQEEPFSTNTRSLLVENILNNIDFKYKKVARKIKVIKIARHEAVRIDDSDEENDQDHKHIGMQFMLHNHYLKEAFILHDQTSYVSSKRKFEVLSNLNIFENADEEAFFKTIVNLKQDDEQDMRKDLNRSWAMIRNVFKYQPINDIRLYFGEKMGLYFAWTGMFVTTLWLPSIVGLVFFIVGLERSVTRNQYTNQNFTL